MKRRQLRRPLSAPILWGLEQGHTVGQVAVGLGIREVTVVEAVELFGPRWLSRQIRRVWREARRIDHDRAMEDWAYANWLRARLAATQLLNDMGEM